MNDPTDYEIGNEIMHRIVDEMFEYAKITKFTHPWLSKTLIAMGKILGVAVNDLMDQHRMCPESGFIESDVLKIKMSTQQKDWTQRK